jgi:glycosyltransferase involved in cell wall biosynthesis
LEVSLKKLKVLTISDHPLMPSGVSHSMRHIIISLLQSDKFDVVSIAGAMKHLDYRPAKTQEWGDRWVIIPVDGFGTQELVRDIVNSEKIDLILFQSDPRFYDWLLYIDNEIRRNVPMVWYAIWDNYPIPYFNKATWSSVDRLVNISKVTHELVNYVTPQTKNCYMPHAVNNDIFKRYPLEEIKAFKEQNFKNHKDKFIFFWNNKNGGRKQPATLMHAFAKFLNKVGHDKAVLLMHTDPHDVHGPNLIENLVYLGMEGKILFSTNKLPEQQLAMLYNMSDCSINISDAEGFGLGVQESLSCETPVIVNMTGGMKEQITDGENFFGVGIEPASKAIIGSQQVPYIYEDRVAIDDVVEAMEKMYNMSETDRRELGKMARNHVMNNFSLEKYYEFWPRYMEEVNSECGSWPNKEFKHYTLTEVK